MEILKITIILWHIIKYIAQRTQANKYYNNDYIDSKLRVISAALNELSDRIAALEGTK